MGGGEEAYELRRSGACWLGADLMLEAACRCPGAAGKDKTDMQDVAVIVGRSGVPAVREVVKCEPGSATTGPWLLARAGGGGGAGRVWGAV